MKRVKIMRGVPGCGKSTYIKTARAIAETEGDLTYVYSADNFFIGANNVYRFDPKKLGAAHGRCLRDFTAFLSDFRGLECLAFVDNTNTTLREITTYVDLCLANEVEFVIVTIDTPPEIAAHRNTHGVPVEKVFQMHRRLLAAQIPKDWPHIVVPGVIV